MEIIKFKDWVFKVDTKLTQKTYSEIAFGSAIKCGCDLCLNFESQKDTIYPNEILKLIIRKK